MTHRRTTSRPGGPRSDRPRLRAFLVAIAVVLGGLALTPPPAQADPVFPPPGRTKAAPKAGSGTGSLVTVAPRRVRDTRNGTGGAKGAVRAGATTAVTVLGRAGVPRTGVGAVVLNVTAVGATRGGQLTAYPSGAARPAAATVQFGAKTAVSVLTVVKIGRGGRVVVHNGSSGTVHIAVDVLGYYASQSATSGSARQPTLQRTITPFRARDTRAGVGGAKRAVAARGTTTVQVRGRGGVPASGATAVVANVTSTGSSRSGSLIAYASGSARPSAATVNFGARATVSNLVILKIGTGGRISVHNSSGGSTQVIVDVVGWFGPGEASRQGGLFTPLVPSRLRDTRSGTGGARAVVPARGSTTVTVLGRGGVPKTGAGAIVANVTVTGAKRSGSLITYPTGSRRPVAAAQHHRSGQTVTGLVVVRLGSGGRITVHNASSGSAHVIVDVIGYLTAGSSTKPSGAPAGAGAADANRPDVPAATSVPRSLQHAVARDLSRHRNGRGAVASNGGAELQADADLQANANSPAFPVGDWNYAQTRPDPAVGRIYNLDRNNNIVGFCSGTVVARNLVITAAHCLTSAGYAFAPQQFGSAFPYGAWYASAYVAAAPYRGGANMGADWGYLIFDNPDANGQLIGDRTGWFGISTDPPGGQKYSMGYPSEGWFNTNCSSSGYGSCFPVYCASTISSSQQYALEASDASVSYGGWWSQGFGCYMTGGASGGPVFQQIGSTWYVVGVNSHVDIAVPYTENCTRPSKVCVWYASNMWAPYLNQVVLTYYYAYYRQ